MHPDKIDIQDFSHAIQLVVSGIAQKAISLQGSSTHCLEALPVSWNNQSGRHINRFCMAHFISTISAAEIHQVQKVPGFSSSKGMSF